jgi:hypothetical protein
MACFLVSNNQREKGNQSAQETKNGEDRNKPGAEQPIPTGGPVKAAAKMNFEPGCGIHRAGLGQEQPRALLGATKLLSRREIRCREKTVGMIPAPAHARTNRERQTRIFDLEMVAKPDEKQEKPEEKKNTVLGRLPHGPNWRRLSCNDQSFQMKC